jgi:cell division protein FtsW
VVKHIGIDKALLAVVLILIVIGMLMIYSTTMIVAKEKYGDSFFFFKKQLLWLALSLIVFLGVILLEKPLYLQPKVIMAVLGITLLGLGFVFFFEKVNNTNRWIRIAGFSLQPSEFAKIAAVIYLAWILSRKSEEINNPKALGLMLLPVVFIEGLIIQEPDFGNFILILLITLVMLFVAGLHWRYFLGLFAFLVPFLYVLIRIDPVRMSRVLSFLNPEGYATTSGFQALQSIWAIGSGGLFGQGIGNSTQKLFFLPYAYTDFIFAIVAEELGLIGAVLVIGLFLAYCIRGILIARNSDSPHIYLLVTGLTFLVVLQAMINVSVTIGIFPTKGIPLPFISSGGTSLLCALMATGIVLNVSRHRKMVFAND